MGVLNNVLEPFVFLIGKIFEYSFKLSGNYGISIVLLSLVISVLLLPIFILIEKVKKKDNALKQKMKPVYDEIRRCYKGRERYYYIRTLYRQHNYKSVHTLFPTLSLLVQIPFFIAAYQYLGGLQSLNGIRFLFIDNLAVPDALFGKVNVLPILMTLINLVSAYFYTRNGNTTERKQMLLVAVLFLVLLFKLPAGLVLYWTMNNVFSFFRLFVTNPEVFKRGQNKIAPANKGVKLSVLKEMFPRLWYLFIFIGFALFLGQLNWSLANGFEMFALRIASVIGGSILLVMVLAGLSVIHDVENPIQIKGLKGYFLKYRKTFRPLFYILFIVAILFQLNWAFTFNFDGFVLRLIGVALGAFVLSVLLAVIVLYLRGCLKDPLLAFVEMHVKHNKNYKFLYASFSILMGWAQINWAKQMGSYDTIVPRLLVALVVSWILTLILANCMDYVRQRYRPGGMGYLRYLLANGKNFLQWLFAALLVISFLQVDKATQMVGLPPVSQIFFVVVLSSVVTFVISLIMWLPTRMDISLIPYFKRPKVLYILLFFSTYFYLTSAFYYKGFNTVCMRIAGGLLVPTLLLGARNFWVARLNRPKIIWYAALLVIIFLFLLYIATSWLFIFDLSAWLVNINDFSSDKQKGQLLLVALGLLISYIFLFVNPNQPSDRATVLKGNYLYVYILSVVYLSGFIFLWHPLSVFASFPGSFEFSGTTILTQNLGLFLLTLGGLMLAYFVLPKKAKGYWLQFILTITVLGFIHNTLLPINLGTLQEGVYLLQDKLAQPVGVYFLEGISIVCIVYAIQVLLRKGYHKKLTVGLVLLNIILISQSLIASVNAGALKPKEMVLTNLDRTLSFSKKEQNVLFILVDMFHGWYMERILKENPELKDVFEGFTWYPNALSVSSTTAGTIPAFWGGYDFLIDSLNKDKERTFEEKITDLSIAFANKVKSKGYSFTSSDLMYSKINKGKFDAYLPFWDDSWDIWNKKLKIGMSTETGFTLLWENSLFYTVPLFIKPRIYNKANWMHGDLSINSNTNETKPYNFLRLLPYISHTEAEKPTFTFLYSKASHHPWDIVDGEGGLHRVNSPYKNNEWVLKTLAKWIKWMKANDVYDNTKIILVSDHGPHWDADNLMKEAGDMPIVKSKALKMQPYQYARLFPLFMTKDYKRQGELKSDSTFVSNADAYYMAFDEKSPYQDIPTDEKELPFSYVEWQKHLWLKENVYIMYTGRVKGNVYDLKNWEVD